jgi:hypothetical protein
MPQKQPKPPANKPKRTKQRKKKPKLAVERGPDVPHWLPADNRWNQMPQEIRLAVSRILAPAYRRFVLDAPGELERSIGLTLVHLMWIEVCDQVKMAVVGADPNSLDAVLSSPDDMIERHLRLATVKCQTAELLLKLRVASEMFDQQHFPPLPLQPQPLAVSQLTRAPDMTVNATPTSPACPHRPNRAASPSTQSPSGV